jgi:hypothetical protein
VDKNDNQHIPFTYNAYMLEDRTINELIGLAKGIAADGLINKDEGLFLLGWLQRNAKYAENTIINILFSRVKVMLQDNVLDHEEQEELLQLLRSISGDQGQVHRQEATAASFPLDNPPPPIIIENKCFCLTGTFAYGPRKICEEAIIEKWGLVKTTISNWVDYLVIGNLCSEQWIHTTYGRKIEKAMQLRDDPSKIRPYGERIAIIHEDHWANHIFS